jgi:hypothetical protein
MSDETFYRVQRTDCSGGGGVVQGESSAQLLVDDLNEKYDTDAYEYVATDDVSFMELLSGTIVSTIENHD